MVVAATVTAAAGCAARHASPGANMLPVLGIGTPATAQEIALLDIDVMPDGTGLPPGAGSAREGAALYAQLCVACHGATGREGPSDRLAGRLPGDAFPFGDEPGLRRTVGSYWPYATTLFDYIRRAMPPASPGSLADAQVYALSAYVLHLNELLDYDTPLDARTLAQVQMPSRERFVPDDRRGGPEVR